MASSRTASRASSPYPMEPASSEIQSMLSAPGKGIKLPSFKRKNNIDKHDANGSNVASTSTSTSTPATSGHAGPSPGSSLPKEPSSSMQTAADGSQVGAIRNASTREMVRTSSGDRKGKGRASASPLDVEQEQQHQPTDHARNSKRAAQTAAETSPTGEESHLPSPAANVALARSTSRSRSPPDKAIPPDPPNGGSDDEDDDADDTVMQFDMDAQINAALGSSSNADSGPASAMSAQAGPMAASGSGNSAPRSAAPVAELSQAEESANALSNNAMEPDNDDDDDEEVAFDFDGQLAAAMAGSSAAQASGSAAVAGEARPGTTSATAASEASDDDDDDDDDEGDGGFDLDKALAAAGAGGAVSGNAEAASSSIAAAAIGSDGDSDGDDAEEAVFDMDKALAAAVGAPSGTETAAPVIAAVKNDDEGDDDLDFDFDKHLALALAATPRTAASALPNGPLDPALQAMLVSPAPGTHAALLPAAAAMEKPDEIADAGEDDSDEEEAGFDMNAMLANAMAPTATASSEARQVSAPVSNVAAATASANAADTNLSLELDIQQTLGAAFASASVAVELSSDSGSGSDSDSDISSPKLDFGLALPDAGQEDEDEGFDMDAQLQAAMSGVLPTWATEGESASASPAPGIPSVPGLDLDMPVPGFSGRQGIKAGDSDDSASSSSSGSDGDSDDEEAQATFDLDAQIGKAMHSVSASVVPEASQSRASAADRQQAELQNMLAGAMRQAALEVELEADPYMPEQQIQDFEIEIPEITEEDLLRQQQQQAQSPAWDAIPEEPRTRPSLKDDGSPQNAFNRSRKAHPQIVHSIYACPVPGCDRVYAKATNRDKHLSTHVLEASGVHACPHCPLRFADAADAADHLRTHDASREWRYRCRGCHNLFGTKEMLDRHAYAAAGRQPMDDQAERCKRGVFELAWKPIETLYPSRFAKAQQPAQEQEAISNPFFTKTAFDSAPLLAAAMVTQLSALLSRQYERQSSLRLPSEPALPMGPGLSQTIAAAGLTPKESAALASVLATVGAARNEGLKASLKAAREVQIENLRRQHEHQERIKAEVRRRELERVSVEQERRQRVEREKKERAKARREALGGDIPVPQAQAAFQ